MRILSDILNFLFPRQCVMCGKRLAVSERSICVSCIMHLPRTDYVLGRKESKLEKLFWTKFPVERAASFFYFTDKSRDMIHSFKYSLQPSVGYDLARIAAEEMAESGFFAGIDAIVPVPIHKMRMLQRHFNQSDYIAKGISAETGIPVWNDVVKRAVNNPSQTRLSRDVRRKNAVGIFQLMNGEKISGKHILLVDDVITTGSTVLSCATTLASAGNVRVSLFSLARAVPGHIPATGDSVADPLVWGMPLLE